MYVWGRGRGWEKSEREREVLGASKNELKKQGKRGEGEREREA
jgi:hypothetical protein